MCPIANEFLLGSRLHHLDTDGDFSSHGHAHSGVETNTDGNTIQDHGLSVLSTGSYKVATGDPHYGAAKLIYVGDSTEVWVAVSTGGTITYNETDGCYMKITTKERLFEMYRLNSTKWIIASTSKLTFATST